MWTCWLSSSFPLCHTVKGKLAKLPEVSLLPPLSLLTHWVRVSVRCALFSLCSCLVWLSPFRVRVCSCDDCISGLGWEDFCCAPSAFIF